LLSSYQKMTSLHLGVESVLIERESTGNTSLLEKRGDIFFASSRKEIYPEQIKDPIIRQINMLDNMLGACNNTDIKILQSLLKGDSNTETAEIAFVSIDTVKYRLKKIYHQLQVNNRYELISLLREYNIALGKINDN